MKWHRILFWLLLLCFFFITIGMEAGPINKESVTRFFQFTGLTAGLIFLVDKVLFPKLMAQKRYGLFTIFLVVAVIVVLFILQQTDRLLFGPSVGSWSDQLVGNAFFILPWVIIALSLFIAEDYGRMRLEKTRNELRYLRHQINPHFLLNTHNNIHFLIEQDPQLAAATLLQLSGIMQYMLYECSADTVPLSKECKNLVNYINLEKIRKEPTLVVSHNLDVVTSTQDIAPLLLISFVENAFKHVSHHKEEENFITINADIVDDVLNFSVQNTKSMVNTASTRSGIGLENVQQRLRLLYPKKHSLIIKNEREIYSVFLTIQLN